MLCQKLRSWRLARKSKKLSESSRQPSVVTNTKMEITYSVGPRFIDGVNIDADVKAGFPDKEVERAIDEPVTGLGGKGYEPGQKNRDGSDV